MREAISDLTSKCQDPQRVWRQTWETITVTRKLTKQIVKTNHLKKLRKEGLQTKVGRAVGDKLRRGGGGWSRRESDNVNERVEQRAKWIERRVTGWEIGESRRKEERLKREKREPHGRFVRN